MTRHQATRTTRHIHTATATVLAWHPADACSQRVTHYSCAICTTTDSAYWKAVYSVQLRADTLSLSPLWCGPVPPEHVQAPLSGPSPWEHHSRMLFMPAGLPVPVLLYRYIPVGLCGMLFTEWRVTHVIITVIHVLRATTLLLVRRV